MPKTSKAKTTSNRNREVHRFFRGLPVVDAEDTLRIVVNRQDIRGATRLDPNNCVFAQACRRLFNSHAVLFLRRTAYVELPNEDGIRQVNRYMISHETAQKIAHFDKTGEAEEGGFLLLPPTPSKRMEAHKAYSLKYRNDVAYGRRTPKRHGPIKERKSRTMFGVRDGRGKLGINYAL